MSANKGKKFYAVKKGRNPGIYTTWAECHAQVSEFKGAVFKSFVSIADAKKFIDEPDRPRRSVKWSTNVNDTVPPAQETRAVKADVMRKIDKCLDAICGTVETEELKHDGFRINVDEFLSG